MYLGVVARALPLGFELHDRPARLHIAQTHPLGDCVKIWGENNTHYFGWGGQKCNKTDQLSGMAGVCDVGGPRIESRQATFFWLFV